jgi:hypothetical protein
MAEVQAPVEILRRGFFFVDTPGLGSAVRENTATTLNFLPNADAIVFVTSCDAPLTEAELGYLRQCRSVVRQLFLVVNKMDLVSPSEGEGVLEFVKAKAREELGETEVRVYGVSARDALAARLKGSAESLDRTGIGHLETELIDYLTSEKHFDFLLQACDRASEIVAASGVAARDILLGRITPLRHEIESNGPSSRTPGRVLPETASPEAKSSVLRVTCLICDKIVDRVLGFLRTYQYDLYVSAEVQFRHAEAGGFCPMHTWQYASLASPQGICSAYPQLLFRFSEDLQELAEGRGRSHGSEGVVGPPLPASDTCPACRAALEAEVTTVQEIAEHLDKTANGDGIRDKRFCLTHLEKLLLSLHSTSAGAKLLVRESDALRRIAENLQRFALKHEGRRSDLITEEEWQAPKQALTLLAGHRNVLPRFEKN